MPGRPRIAGFAGTKKTSKLEARRANELALMQRAGLISDLQCQVSFELIPKLPRQHATVYIADFVYTENGQRVVEDVKGFKTEIYRIKAKLMRWVHGVTILETGCRKSTNRSRK